VINYRAIQERIGEERKEEEKGEQKRRHGKDGDGGADGDGDGDQSSLRRGLEDAAETVRVAHSQV
jgi:hypothetical protein